MLAWYEILSRLFLASLFGALIGLERERKDWTAGMRTHMMVSVGSSLIMMVSSFGFSDALGTEHVVLDPARVAAQVISGIGFIGAGTILFMREGTIRGLTTATGLWTVAAIGLATGGGMYFAAAATTFIALIILWALQPIEQRIASRFKQKTLRIVAELDFNVHDILNEIEHTKEAKLASFLMDKNDKGLIIQLKFENVDISKLAGIITSLQGNIKVKEFFWTK